MGFNGLSTEEERGDSEIKGYDREAEEKTEKAGAESEKGEAYEAEGKICKRRKSGSKRTLK